MTQFAYLIVAVLAGNAAAGIVDLNCSDNATCIDNLARDFVKALRQQKTVRLFDTLTVEPLGRRQARANQGLLSKFLTNYALSFDWDDFTFRLSQPVDRSDALDFEILQSRTAKEEAADQAPKKSASKVEEKEKDSEDKTSKTIRRRRRRRKRVVQALVPLLFGMKSAAVVLFGLAVVTVLTLKAFIASKAALLVTVGMAAKKLYETYGHGVGLQNHPYLYSQYPIDFPSASSQAYSVSGVSPQFASPEMYSPTALATQQQQTHELLHTDASAQPSQQAPSVLTNSTRAAERWDGYRRRPMFYGTSRTTSESFSATPALRH